MAGHSKIWNPDSVGQSNRDTGPCQILQIENAEQCPRRRYPSPCQDSHCPICSWILWRRASFVGTVRSFGLFAAATERRQNYAVGKQSHDVLPDWQTLNFGKFVSDEYQRSSVQIHHTQTVEPLVDQGLLEAERNKAIEKRLELEVQAYGQYKDCARANLRPTPFCSVISPPKPTHTSRIT